MKITGRNLRRRLSTRVSNMRNRLGRARYFRGHGVHSPFVYDIVRKVFMRNSLLPGDHALFMQLTGYGVSVRRAIQLQNLSTYCGYGAFGLNCANDTFCVATRELSVAETLELVRKAAECGATVAVMAPAEGRERQEMCSWIVAGHPCTTVDNHGYLLIFNNYLPKQHFRI